MSKPILEATASVRAEACRIRPGSVKLTITLADGKATHSRFTHPEQQQQFLLGFARAMQVAAADLAKFNQQGDQT